VDNSKLFTSQEVKSEVLSIRLTPAQKQAVFNLAKRMEINVSRLFLHLVGAEFQRLENL
jgi:hypothetical protein